jgi:hypothetical protein
VFAVMIAENTPQSKDNMEFLNPYTTKPRDLKPGDNLCYVVVATVGDVGDWAAYAGLADWTPDQVATEGEKIDQKAAERLFPVCVNAGLRWRD